MLVELMVCECVCVGGGGGGGVASVASFQRMKLVQ